jgi:hypothetical protein
MEGLLTGDTAVYIIAALSAIVAAEQAIAASALESNSTLQLIGKLAGGLLKLIKR